MRKRMLAVLLSVVMVLGMLPVTASAVEGDDSVYLALGDSITTGYAPPLADGTPQKVESPFADQVAAAQGYTLDNRAEDGETSTSLLGKLQKTDSEELAAAAAAELITITIGGNDLMGALYGYLAEKYVEDKPDVQDFDADDVREMLVAGNPDFLSFASQKISGFALSTQAHTALSGFTTNLNAIIGAIKQVNSDATILVATQYNPYYYLAKSMEGTPLFADIASKISSAFEAGVAALNYVVSDGTPAGYQVVDVYTAFNTAADSGTNPCNPSVNLPTFSITLDFHPNQTGHDLIAATITDTLFEDLVLWVGGIQVTSENYTDVLGNEDGDGATVAYDIVTNTLTLNGATITQGYDVGDGDYSGIYAKDDLNLKLKGTNSITLNVNYDYIRGVSIGGDLVVTGSDTSDTLRVDILDSTYGDGIFAYNGNVYISNCTITATGNNYGNGILASRDVNINSSVVTAEGKNAALYAENLSVNGTPEDIQLCTKVEITTDGGITWSGSYPIWVGGIQVTSENYTDVLGDADEGATVTYNTDTNTLTLKDAKITAGDNSQNSGIYSAGPLNIHLVGENEIQSESADSAFSKGILIDGDLAVTGDGSLTAAGDDYGIYVDYNLTVNGGSVTGTGTDYGIYVYYDLTVSDGTVTGNATGSNSWGICTELLTMTGGEVTGKGGNAAIVGYHRGSAAATDVIVLPETYIPAGYELKALQDSYGDTLVSFVPTGGELTFDEAQLFTGAAKEITLKARENTEPVEPDEPSGGGSSGGGSSGSSGSTTETTQNPDGSTTTTVTRPDGSTTETTEKPDGSQEVVSTDKDGTVTTTTTDPEGNKTEIVEKTDGSSQTTVTNEDGSSSVTVSGQDGRSETQVKLPDAVTDNAEEKGEAVKLPMPAIPVASDSETASTVTVDLPAGKSAKVEIPVENPAAGTVAILVKEDGSEEIIKTSVAGESGVFVTLQDGDKVKIVDNSKDYADVSDSYWGTEAVDFVSSREMMNGVGNDSFAPDSNLTRGMIAQVLYNLEDDPEAGSDVFGDVEAGQWYADAVNWAAANNIVSGYGDDTFGPQKDITREQMAQILYNYAVFKGYDVSVQGDLSAFEDGSETSDWALPAMEWAVGSGLLQGYAGILNPDGTATRAEVAQILMNFCEKIMMK